MQIVEGVDTRKARAKSLGLCARAISFLGSAILLVCAKDLDAWSLQTKAIVGSGNEIGARAKVGTLVRTRKGQGTRYKIAHNIAGNVQPHYYFTAWP